jgi:hypothetical protein
LAGVLISSALWISTRNPLRAAGGALPAAANPVENLGGRMPPDFDREVARVVAKLDRIEVDTLSPVEHTTLGRQFQVPTLRNVDMRPTAEFVKAYMHNGYFKSLKEVVHFYNTRDVLPKSNAGDAGEKVSCWPAPEDSTNLNKRQLGNLKLTDQEEDALVSFLKTLTDGYQVPNARAVK